MADLFECQKCKSWGFSPEGVKWKLNQTGKCPKCGTPMFLLHGYTPAEIGLDGPRGRLRKVSVTEPILCRGGPLLPGCKP